MHSPAFITTTPPRFKPGEYFTLRPCALHDRFIEAHDEVLRLKRASIEFIEEQGIDVMGTEAETAAEQIAAQPTTFKRKLLQMAFRLAEAQQAMWEIVGADDRVDLDNHVYTTSADRTDIMYQGPKD